MLSFYVLFHYKKINIRREKDYEKQKYYYNRKNFKEV